MTTDTAHHELLATEAGPRAETIARHLAHLEDGEPWPTNEKLGGSATGDRDIEYHVGMLESARELIEVLDNVNASTSVIGHVTPEQVGSKRPYENVEEMLDYAETIADTSQIVRNDWRRISRLLSDLVSHTRGMQAINHTGGLIPAADNGMSTAPALHHYVSMPRQSGKALAEALYSLASITGLTEKRILDMINVAQTEDAVAGVIPPTFETPRVTATHAETLPTATETIEALAAALDTYPSDRTAIDELQQLITHRTGARLVAAIRNAQKEAAS